MNLAGFYNEFSKNLQQEFRHVLIMDLTSFQHMYWSDHCHPVHWVWAKRESSWLELIQASDEFVWARLSELMLCWQHDNTLHRAQSASTESEADTADHETVESADC